MMYWHIDGDMSLSEPWIGVTRFELLNKETTRRTLVGSRLTDKETGYFKTWTILVRRIVQHVETSCAKP